MGYNRYIYTNCIITSAHLINGAKDYVMNRSFDSDISNKMLMFTVSKIEVLNADK